MAAKASKAARAAAAGRAVIYLRVSTDEQAASGLGLEAQEAAARQLVAGRGWEVAAVLSDEGVSGSVAPAERPGMAEALRMLCDGEAGVLVAAKLDRLSRSTTDLLSVVDEAERCGFAVVTADAAVDMTTAAGRFVVTALGAVAELERGLTRERTRAALAAKKARGCRLGRPVTLSAEVRARVAELRAAGLSVAAVAAALNAEGCRQGNGAEWTKSAAQRVLRSLQLDAEAAAVRAGRG